MSWYEELGRVTLIDSGEHVRAIGWLSDQHSFARGELSPAWLPRLKAFSAAWQASSKALGWGFCMGPHCCELCGNCLASGNFGVPADELLYVAPEMLPHYVEVHGYAPPQAFIAALEASPLPGTEAYAAAVVGFRDLHARHLERQFERIYAEAARFARERGGDAEALSASCRHFFAADLPDIRERVRAALQSLPSQSSQSTTPPRSSHDHRPPSE